MLRPMTNSQPKRRGHKIITQTGKMEKIDYKNNAYIKTFARVCSARLEASAGQIQKNMRYTNVQQAIFTIAFLEKKN